MANKSNENKTGTASTKGMKGSGKVGTSSAARAQKGKTADQSGFPGGTGYGTGVSDSEELAQNEQPPAEGGDIAKDDK